MNPEIAPGVYDLTVQNLRITNPIWRKDLYRMLAQPFSKSHPIRKRDDFTDVTEHYIFEKGDTVKDVLIYVPPERVQERLLRICDLLTLMSLRRRSDGSAGITRDEAYDTYSVIACNWLSIHGCLGVNGHGRSTIRLFPLTMHAAGYKDDIDERQFNTRGIFDIEKSKRAIVWLNGHLNAGKRILAAYDLLNIYGTVEESLLNPMIPFDDDAKRVATIYTHAVLKHAKKRKVSYLEKIIYIYPFFIKQTSTSQTTSPKSFWRWERHECSPLLHLPIGQ